MAQHIPVVHVPVLTPDGETARFHLSIFGIPLERFNASLEGGRLAYLDRFFDYPFGEYRTDVLNSKAVPEFELRPVPSFYLTEEASTARIEKLLSRITRELRSKEGPFMHDPKSDFWKLPNDQRARVVERLKILEAEAKLEAANSRSKTYGNR